MDATMLYKGYKEIITDDDSIWASVYEPDSTVDFGLLQNEYALLKSSSGNSDIFKMTEKGLKKISYKTVNSSQTDKIRPRNPQQEMLFDMLQDKETTIKVVTGKFGSGKSFCMIAHALQMVEQNKFDKIVWVRNNVGVKDTKDVGALPGDLNSKLMDFAMPFADHVGGTYGVENLMRQGRLEIQHLGFIRGRDIQNAIILCSEAENLTKQHVQLLIGRVSTGSNLWLDGDFKQTDGKIFEENNGMRIAIDKLKGQPRFGYVHLEKSERSETAAMADLLD